MTLGEFVKNRRVAVGLTVQDVSQMMGYKYRTKISQLEEKNVNQIPRNKFQRLATILKVNERDLVACLEPEETQTITMKDVKTEENDTMKVYEDVKRVLYGIDPKDIVKSLDKNLSYGHLFYKLSKRFEESCINLRIGSQVKFCVEIRNAQAQEVQRYTKFIKQYDGIFDVTTRVVPLVWNDRISSDCIKYNIVNINENIEISGEYFITDEIKGV